MATTKPIKVTATEFKELANLCRTKHGDTIDHSIKSIALEGAPGMGKTSVIQDLARDWKLPCVTVAINQWSNPADIVGFTFKGRKHKDGSFDLEGVDDIPAWLPVWRVAPNGERVQTDDRTKGYRVWLDDKGQPVPHPAVILLDEFSAAMPKIQQTFLTVCLSKKVKNFSLDDDTNFFVAFNSSKRKGFVGQTFDISEAMGGPNGRFDIVELTFEPKPVVKAILANDKISDFWKKFTEKYFGKQLKIYDDQYVGDFNVCGRTYENVLIRLSNGNFNSKNWSPLATKLVEMEFAGSPKVIETFLSLRETFDIPTGEDYLNGTVAVDNYSDAIIGINAMISLFGFRKRCDKAVISAKENAALQAFMDKNYPTGTKKADGSLIIGSRKELYLVLKNAIYHESLECLPEFSWVAGVLDNFEEEETSSEEEEACEF